MTDLRHVLTTLADPVTDHTLNCGSCRLQIIRARYAKLVLARKPTGEITKEDVVMVFDASLAMWKKGRCYRYYQELKEKGLTNKEIEEAFAAKGWTL